MCILSSQDIRRLKPINIDVEVKDVTSGSTSSTSSGVTNSNGLWYFCYLQRPSNAYYANNISKFYNRFWNTHVEGKGICARYTWMLAYYFVKGNKPEEKNEAAGGNANDRGYWDRLKSLGYTMVVDSQTMSKKDLGRELRRAYNPGDVVVYWAQTGSDKDHAKKFGHTQMYVGESSKSRWTSDKEENYGLRFVYDSNV